MMAGRPHVRTAAAEFESSVLTGVVKNVLGDRSRGGTGKRGPLHRLERRTRNGTVFEQPVDSREVEQRFFGFSFREHVAGSKQACFNSCS
jgi:hypothetical protein